MSYNLVFKISKETLTILKMKKDTDEASLNNTNIIDIKDLKFSNVYIKENFELVSNFLNVVILKKNIKTVQINNLEIALDILDLIATWEHISKIIFKPDKTISLEIFLKLLENPYLKEINCHEMNKYLIDRINLNKNIKIITRHKHNYVSSFMKNNMMESYSDIYYKKMIIIQHDFTKEEIDEFKTFIAFNDRLKVIRIISYSNELLTIVLEELSQYKKKNILIEIVEKNNDINTIYNTVPYLKKVYRKYIEECHITFKLTYSKEYKKAHFLKEINVKLLSTIFILIILVGTLTVGINYYMQFKDEEKINDQINDFEEILNEAEVLTNDDNNENDIEYIKPNEESTTTTKKASKPSAYYTNYSAALDKLTKKNKDTVAWLEVNETQIKYPVVQSDSNSYYLNRDFNKKKNSMGWIFMDYRNNPTELNQNTIIYGHNIKTGIMFGTLKYALNSSWYKKPSNQVITFNTKEKDMKWQIFSIYKVKATEDYLKTEFSSNEEFADFINMIKERSIHDFGIEVTPESKILTLTTCHNHTSRHVVHAVLLPDEESNE